MEEVYIFVRESRAREKRKARALLYRAIREGKAPGMGEMARARGLVIRERENSIFSDAWIPLAILFIVIGLVAGRNPAFLSLGFALLAIVGVGTLWKRAALVGVTYERSFDRTHVFPGERISMTITVSNLKPLPLTWLRFSDELPIAPEERGQEAIVASEISGGSVLSSTYSIGAYERMRRSFVLRFRRRGFYRVGPVTYSSGDIFTLFTIERRHRYLDNLVVYPQVWPLATLELPAKEIFGEMNVRRSLFRDPIKSQGIREYQPQDHFRDVHWKASARHGQLQTKVYDPSTGVNVVVFLNVATYPKHWMGFDPELLERTISVAASIASYTAEQKWGLGIIANGSVPGSDQPIRVAPGRSPEQLMRVLEALAAVTEFATGSIELLMSRESNRLPWSATLVLVTAVVTEEMMVSLIRMKEAGRRITLISLADKRPGPGPTLDGHGILTYHIPREAPAFRRSHPAGSSSEASLAAIPYPLPAAFESPASLEDHDQPANS